MDWFKKCLIQITATYREKKAIIIRDLLKKMASVFWNKLLQYKRQPKLKFSTDWLKNFKVYHSIKKYWLYKKAEIVDIIVIEEKFQEIREIF